MGDCYTDPSPSVAGIIDGVAWRQKTFINQAAKGAEMHHGTLKLEGARSNDASISRA
jgi:hypothetical protein